VLCSVCGSGKLSGGQNCKSASFWRMYATVQRHVCRVGATSAGSGFGCHNANTTSGTCRHGACRCDLCREMEQSSVFVHTVWLLHWHYISAVVIQRALLVLGCDTKINPHKVVRNATVLHCAQCTFWMFEDKVL
jgi:hypothetical protein